MTNKKTTLSTLTAAIFLTTLLFTACKKDEPTPTPETKNTNVVFIVNEGGFGNGNASISKYDLKSTTVTADVYSAANNGLPLGDVAQNMVINNNNAYIVLNNSKKLKVVGIADFKQTAEITNFAGPRFFLAISTTKAYVSDWSTNGDAKVIDLVNNKITSTISTGKGPEGMLAAGGNIYIANSGGFADDSTITVVNPTTDAVINTIKVGDIPKVMATDANGKLWVLTSGSYKNTFTNSADDSQGRLVRINPSSNTVEVSILIGNVGDHPDRLAINKAKTALYFTMNNAIYKMNITDTAAPTSAFISNSNFKYVYGIGVDPNNDDIYVADGGDFNSASKAYHYSAAGSLVNSINVGIGPNGFVFN